MMMVKSRAGEMPGNGCTHVYLQWQWQWLAVV
jgi:hypothetical protein